MTVTTCSNSPQAKAESRKGANLEAELCQGRLDALFEHVRDGLAILDRDLTVTKANKVLHDIFPGIPLVGEKCFKAFRRKSEPCLNCPAFQSMREGETIHGRSPPAGQYQAPRELQWTLSPIFAPSGQVEEILLILRYADTLPNAKFLAGIAHEINNPLASITGFSEGLLKRLKAAPEGLNGRMVGFFKEYLEIINNEAYRCKGILQRIMRENGVRRG